MRVQILPGVQLNIEMFNCITSSFLVLRLDISVDTIALSASVQIRRLFGKNQNTLWLYGQYNDPKSKKAGSLSPEEKERLLDLFLHELRIFIDQFGGRIF